MSAKITVIGIDPGSTCTGWGIVQEVSGVLTLVDCGAIRPKAKEFSERIGEIFWALSQIIQAQNSGHNFSSSPVNSMPPMEAAIEDVFGGKSISSALKLGQARGAAVAACALHKLAVSNYPPTRVKQAVVGVGRAEKSQVSFMVGRLLGCQPNWALDTSDALAVAICHLNLRRLARFSALVK